MINHIIIFFVILFFGITQTTFAMEQHYEIKGSVGQINNTENNTNNYDITNKTVTINNKTHKVYIDKSSKQYYKIKGKFVPIINTEINTKK